MPCCVILYNVLQHANVYDIMGYHDTSHIIIVIIISQYDTI